MPTLSPITALPAALSLNRGMLTAVVLTGLAGAVFALSAWLGVPVVGQLFGRDADFAIMSLALLDAAWTEGMIWPRWLMDSNDGLGAATFVSYPPVAYWAAVLVRKLSRLQVTPALALTTALWRCLALLTTWLWLRRHVAASPALAAAALAALLPYPALFNPWVRFAYAEIAGAALLPLLLLATERASADPGLRGLPGLGLAFAALAMTHVPSCALAAHLVPLYALGYGGPRAAFRCILGGVLGAALAACFLVPAFGLMGASGASELSNQTWQDMLMFWSPLGEEAHWRRFRLMVWAAGWATLLLGLAMAWQLRHSDRWRVGGFGRAALVLLVCAFGLTTVVSLPLWRLLPELTAVEFPWRANGLMVPALAALAALAMDRVAWPATRLEPLLALAAGTVCAAAVPLFLWLSLALGAPEWPRFLPADQRLAFTRAYSGAYSNEHTPGAAVAAGWGEVTAGLPPPHPVPVPPAGTLRLPDGFLVQEASTPFRLPQFHFPVWQAWDAIGPVPLRAAADGFIEVMLDRPAANLHIQVATTDWEILGWAISLSTATGLLVAGIARRPGRAARDWRLTTRLREPGSGHGAGLPSR